MSNLLDFAKSELEFAGYFDGDVMNEAMAEDVLKLIEVFSEQGHSGFSASWTLSLFNELANFKPITPLSGEDNEWFEATEGVFQNKRYSGLFKQADRFNGQAYDINGKVFRDPDGSTWTSSDSFVPVEFPYTPTTEIAEREEEFNNDEN